MAQRTRAVFFDLAGTLITVEGGIGAQYASVAREFGVDCDAASLNAAFPEAFRWAGPVEFPVDAVEDVAVIERRFWRRVVQRVFATTGLIDRFEAGRFDEYFDRLFDYFATSSGWTIYPDVLPTLGEIRARGVIAGLITNFDVRVYPLLQALDLAHQLDSITIPSIARASKPDARIFQHALARHGLEHAADALMVGDSVTDDVEGARAAGLRAVLIHRSDSGPLRVGQAISASPVARSQAASATVIRSLAELLPML